MKRIAVAAALGWGSIVWLGWSLADRRIAICGSWTDASDVACRLRATAARDAILTHGLTVALVAGVSMALLAGGWSRRLTAGKERIRQSSDGRPAEQAHLARRKRSLSPTERGAVSATVGTGEALRHSMRRRVIFTAVAGVLAALAVGAGLFRDMPVDPLGGRGHRPPTLTPVNGDPFGAPLVGPAKAAP